MAIIRIQAKNGEHMVPELGITPIPRRILAQTARLRMRILVADNIALGLSAVGAGAGQ